MIIGRKNIFVNNPLFATLGKNNKCKLVTYKDATLIIGDKVGMSNTTIVATTKIELGNNIIIGGGVTIIDSDFHSLNPNHWHTDEDEVNKVSRPIKICDNVFIGMNVIVLKGVNVGSNSIIAAGSVVVNDIPENEIWGGNPAKFISKRK